ncbi:permease prefix domain 1-containing protein [Cryptosporangium aurantiacum]|uniref:Uncharacterized protein n=1 Tax=Cryptosporangium aurantiacum TaxID=134849 RepID=A0A1M7NP98_9ACTN|nr:permease prefix domain 1-containing protein [Cryptosporangium aurantiacum]SHN05715.1 hypothetical protein SAMN05443668_102756 [Cryptosporangium aurantiacum]
MTTVLDVDPVAALLGDLRARLRGPHRVRHALLQEVDDGLQDAAAAYREAGLAPGEAARRAAAEFGDPADLAPLYQAELDASQGRRSAMLIAVAYPAMTLSWDALWRFAEVGSSDAPPSIASVASLLDLFSYGAAITAAMSLPLFARASARLVRRLAIGVGLLGWLTLVVSVGSSTWMSLTAGGRGVQEVESSAAGVAVVVLTVVASLAVARSATVTVFRGLRISRPWAPTAAR